MLNFLGLCGFAREVLGTLRWKVFLTVGVSQCLNYVVVKLEDWFDTVSSDTYLNTYSGKLVIASGKGPMVE